MMMQPMRPQGGGARLGRVPDPPSWDPAHEATNPFRVWAQKLMVWGILAADLDDAQQAAAIVDQLGGDAAQLALNFSYDDLTVGANVNGVHLGPVTYLLTQLVAAFAPLGEEV